MSTGEKRTFELLDLPEDTPANVLQPLKKRCDRLAYDAQLALFREPGGKEVTLKEFRGVYVADLLKAPKPRLLFETPAGRRIWIDASSAPAWLHEHVEKLPRDRVVINATPDTHRDLGPWLLNPEKPPAQARAKPAPLPPPPPPPPRPVVRAHKQLQEEEEEEEGDVVDLDMLTAFVDEIRRPPAPAPVPAPAPAPVAAPVIAPAPVSVAVPAPAPAPAPGIVFIPEMPYLAEHAACKAWLQPHASAIERARAYVSTACKEILPTLIHRTVGYPPWHRGKMLMLFFGYLKWSNCHGFSDAIKIEDERRKKPLHLFLVRACPIKLRWLLGSLLFCKEVQAAVTYPGADVDVQRHIDVGIKSLIGTHMRRDGPSGATYCVVGANEVTGTANSTALLLDYDFDADLAAELLFPLK
jgi:hypothetical protein